MTESTEPAAPLVAPRTQPHSGGLFAPPRRALVIGLLLTITLVAFESLAVATVMPVVKDDLGGLALYGWVFSGFFLASLAGIEVAGQLADRRGLHLPYTASLVVFVGGLAIAAFAPSMPVLVAGRILQGFGAGAIPSMGYVAIGRGLPEHLRPRMFAALSTAWVLPGLVGPAVASLIEHVASWRWVFGALVPVVVIAGAMTAPALKALDAMAPITDAPAFDRRRLGVVGALVVGVGMALSAGDATWFLALGLAVAGIPLGVWAFTRLQPRGTVRLAPGVPATVAVRGLLTWAFFGADAYVSL
ncbi:MAG: MFS transporter, partial [Actinobacteria bacterium]|nr:MFS transporter [Actinomycetota bacterium]